MVAAERESLLRSILLVADITREPPHALQPRLSSILVDTCRRKRDLWLVHVVLASQRVSEVEASTSPRDSPRSACPFSTRRTEAAPLHP